MRYNTFNPGGANPAWGRFAALYAYRRQLGWAALGVGVVYAANLERAPVTGRLRFMIVPRWLEQKVGDNAYGQTLQQFGSDLLPDAHPRTRRIKAIMDRIIRVADMPADMQWRVHVVRGQHPPNAFVLPGGKVFVFESILPLCETDDGLATVLSHETAHQVCRHSAENLSTAPVRLLVGGLLYAVTGSASIDNLLLSLALELPASRAMETEADYVGLQMMAKACFRPSAAVGLWQRMVRFEQQQGGSVPELLSTHPASAHRISNIESELPMAESLRETYCSHMDEFRRLF